MASIPQTNPHANYLAYQDELEAAIKRVLDSGRYILGEETAAFEREFADYIGVSHCIGVGSGTDALHIALRACNITEGDEVITVSHTAVATVAAIELAGASPVLADVDPSTYTLDPSQLESAITPRTKAIIPVHLYGHPADLHPILETAHRHNLYMIEDCAQAHGAKYNGQRVGSFGDLAAFSFYPTKNLAALGDGGAVVCNDAALANRVRLLRQYGWEARYISTIPGMNSRLDELQAAVLRVKLRKLDDDNLKRRQIADTYSRKLQSTGLHLPVEHQWAKHCYHQYVIRHPQRTMLQQRLTECGIGTLIHYPVPIHLQPAYQGRVKTVGAMQDTERIAHEILSLPMYPELTPKEADYIGDVIIEWLTREQDANGFISRI